MEDDEGGEDGSMQEGRAEEGRRPIFRKSENQPSQDVQEHMKTHIPHRSWCAHCVKEKEEE